MQKILIKIIIIYFFISLTTLCKAQEKPQFPQGTIKGPFVWESKIYPGTVRNYWIYVPQQYDANKAACLMVVQDGLSRAEGWNLNSVLDSLIAMKAIPVMIGVYIDHGVVNSLNDAYPRFNRSFEYDAMGDRYARFLEEEILTEISKNYNISKDPNDRSIAGASSGAIAAFNVAWERPDSFRRVLSTIGSFVGLRGGEEFPKLIRVVEPKPIRIFLEDGSNDLDIYAGGWWTANQSILSALTWAGYEVNHNWGDGGHDSKHAKEILPEALVWLWKDYPQPVKTHPEKTPRRLKSAIEGEDWNEIQLQGVKVEKLAVNHLREVYFSNGKSIFKADQNGTTTSVGNLKSELGGISFNKDGKLYVADLKQQKILAVDEKGSSKEIASNVQADFLSVTDKGIYFSDSKKDRIGFYSFAKKETQYVPGTGNPSGLAVSAEQTFLNVGFKNSLFGHSYKIKEDGSLDHGQEYIHYHKPYGTLSPEVQGMTVDAENILYSATNFGVQVSDQLGRINFIFPLNAANLSDVKLAGKDFNYLYVVADGKLLRRKINAKGVLSWQDAVKPPKPGL